MNFTPPKHCPNCESDLVWRKDQLFCENNVCPAKQSKQVEHFAKTLKIKGLGPNTIASLGLDSIDDIYFFDPNEIESEKIREKLVEEIEYSKTRPFNEVLPALGIPLVGNTASAKLSQVCKSIFDINEETCREAGLGPKATSNILTWLATNSDWLLELPLNFFFKVIKQEKGVVCITGKLKSFKNKEEAGKALEEKGWKVVSSVTKEVTHLVNESGDVSAKTKKAEASGIQIVNNIHDILGD